MTVRSSLQSSRLENRENGVAQGSVLALTLQNVYTYDFPESFSNKYMYANNVAPSFSDSTFSQSEEKLSKITLFSVIKDTRNEKVTGVFKLFRTNYRNVSAKENPA